MVAGNWKMNLTLAEGEKLVKDVAAGLSGAGAVDVVVCPPFVYVHPLASAVGGSIAVGGQDVYYEKSGAFTGEISAPMLKDAGAKYAIIGHSERRHTIGHLEDDRMLNLKAKAALANGLTPIFCVGETLGERKSDKTEEVLTFQIRAGLVDVRPPSPEQLIIAYEPVWAIGTGETASPQQAQDAHKHVRDELRLLYGDQADQIRILYGGSVKPDNAEELFKQPDVDGGLIGGASLKADAFLGIINAAVAVSG
jgi:triosephosphate isomerase